jgi:uncharacterized protein
MAIFAIADLHLSYSENKPMDIFGSGWEGYMDKIDRNWRAAVSDDDTVLIPGDISWAMHICESTEDFRYLDSLPGRKIIIKGNHDYWWDTVSKIERFFKDSGIKTIEILHNNSYRIGDVSVFGTRGWIQASTAGFTQHDMKIYNREIERLRSSIASEKDKSGGRLVMLHYPPVSPLDKDNEFTRIIAENAIDMCIFGHIHSSDAFGGYNISVGRTRYRLVSSDHLGFVPYRIPDLC